jgi:CelD/BcsL family acetyltransferase involved in cellulose biosynthesis
MALEVKIIRDEAALGQLEEAWTSLLGGSEAGTAFASFPWNLAWWHAFGSGKRLYVLVAADSDGQVRGIAPLMLRRAGLMRKLEYIGTGLSDTGDFVLDASHAEEAAEAIFAYLRRHRREWDLLDLDETPPYSPLAGALAKEKPPGLHLIELPRTDCPYIALPDTWEEYTQTLQRKPRQHLESFARRVVLETGASFRLVTEEADVPAAVDRFYKLHLARWAAKEETLNPEHRSPSFSPFLEEVCSRSATQGLLRLAELRVGDDVIASWISFQVNERLNGYMTGFDPAWSSKRPGKVLHGFVVRQALAEHVRELNLGRGAEEYKFEMGAVSRRNRRFMLTNNTPRSIMAFALTMLRIKGRGMVRRYRG